MVNFAMLAFFGDSGGRVVVVLVVKSLLVTVC